MSDKTNEMDKREQAKQLLHVIGEVDDRFLMEAMDAEKEVSGSGKNQRPETTASGPAASSGAKKSLRRYSVWALTAAACLTVVVLGRYVGVNSVKTSVKTAKVTEATDWKEADRGLEQDAGQSADESRNAADAEAYEEAAPAMDTAEEAAPAEMSTIDPADAEDEEALNGMAAKGAAQAGAGAALTMPNPFLDVKTLEEAEAQAGFPITLPKAEKPYERLLYRVIKDEMIEVIYLDGADNEGYRIRKGRDMEEDISGDYNEYAASETRKTSGVQVTARGEEAGQWKTAVWTAEEDGERYSFALCAGARSFTTEEVLEYVERITSGSQELSGNE